MFLTRIDKIRERLADRGTDVFLVSPSSNLFYLTGYGVGPDERLFLLVLPREKDPFIFANLLYKEQVKSLPVRDQVFWQDGEEPFSLLKDEIKKRNIKMKKAALEPQIPAFFSLPLFQAFPDTVFELGSALIDPLRRIKDESELELIRTACRESDRALAAVMDKVWLGKTERDFFRDLNGEFDRSGLSSFGASVQSGANAAIPHYLTGDAAISEGKCLLVDFWGRYRGYYTDCTRTFFFGKPDAEFEKIHSIVLEAYRAAEGKACVGNTLGDVDFAARSVIEKNGYGEYFTHRTGHGLGIDVHEGASAAKGVNVPLEPGLVFTIEPGIYLPGRFGVRHENVVAIGEKGPEVLHKFRRNLNA